MNREKETMEQIATLEREKENLARELASYINKEKDKVLYSSIPSNISRIIINMCLVAFSMFSSKMSFKLYIVHPVFPFVWRPSQTTKHSCFPKCFPICVDRKQFLRKHFLLLRNKNCSWLLPEHFVSSTNVFLFVHQGNSVSTTVFL